MEKFDAITVNRVDDVFSVERRRLGPEDLSAGNVLIRTEYSDLNYKDALALSPDGKIVRTFPLVPGVDLAGSVVSSDSPDFVAGDQVIAHGYGVGVSHDGGFAQYARVPANWLVKLPQGLTTRQTMAIGTAGFTAAMSVARIVDHGITPGDGPILVTGASGGVGSVAVDLLSGLGFEVAASSGKPGAAVMLETLGASEVIPRIDIPDSPRALDSQRWAAVVDSVGGRQLAVILASVKYGGIVAASGLTGGIEVPASVMPFILRSVTLAGIDSVQLNIEARRLLWERLASDLMPAHLDEFTSVIPLDEVPTMAKSLLNGEISGRVVVDLWR